MKPFYILRLFSLGLLCAAATLCSLTVNGQEFNVVRHKTPRRVAAPMRDSVPLAAYGTVIDGQEMSHVAYATVLLVRAADSTVSGYGVTDPNGDFALYTSAVGEHYLQVSSLGYITSSTLIKIPQQQVNIVELYPDPKEIEAVRIEARRRGMQVHGDTVRYNVQAYLTGAEQTLGDLLAQLPDIKITPSGGAIAQGKKVDRILFNGRDLFAGNVPLATKNVGAGVVDSVSVLHGYSEFDILEGFQSKPETVINVGVKPGMLGKISGEVEAGYGWKNTATGRLNAIYMGQANMVAAVGGVNLNTGEPSFSATDLLSFAGGFANFQAPPSEVWAASAQQRNVSKLLTGVGAVYYNYHDPNRLKGRFGAMYTYSAKDASQLLTLITLAGQRQGDTLSLRSRNESQTQGVYLHGGVAWTPTKRWLIDWSMGLSGFATTQQLDHNDFYKAIPFTTNEESKERPLGLQQSLRLNYKTGLGLLELYASYNFNASNPNVTYGGDTLILPLAVAPQANGTYCLEYGTTQKRHEVNAVASMKFDVKADQYFEVKAENSSEILTHSSNFSSQGATLSAHPWMGIPPANAADIRLSDFSLGATWVKNEGSLQAEVSLAGHCYYFDFRQANGHEQGYRWYAEPMISLEYKINALNRVTLNGGIRQGNMSPSFYLYGFVPTSYRSVCYNRAYREFFSSTPYARFKYRYANEDADFVYAFSSDYSYLSSTLNDNSRYGLLEITTPAGQGTGHRVTGDMDVNWTIRSFWDLYVEVKGDYVRDVTREFGENLHTEGWGTGVSARLRTTYAFPLNGSVRGGWGTDYSRFPGQAWWNTSDWNVEGGLTFKLKRFRANVSTSYHAWPALNTREHVELNAEASYNVWKGLTIVLCGSNLLGLKEGTKVNSTFTEVYRRDRVYNILPGYVMAKLRWEFNRGDGGEKKVRIVIGE